MDPINFQFFDPFKICLGLIIMICLTYLFFRINFDYFFNTSIRKPAENQGEGGDHSQSSPEGNTVLLSHILEELHQLNQNISQIDQGHSRNDTFKNNQGNLQSTPVEMSNLFSQQLTQVTLEQKFLAKTMLKHLTPGAFTDQTLGNAVGWLNEIKYYIQTCQVDWPDTLLFISSLFKGYPADWFEVNQHLFINFSEFEKRFMITFSPEVSNESLLIKLFSIEQQPEESLMHYATQLLIIARKIIPKLSEQVIISIIVKHSLPKYQTLLFCRNCLTIDSLLSAINEIENLIPGKTSSIKVTKSDSELLLSDSSVTFRGQKTNTLN